MGDDEVYHSFGYLIYEDEAGVLRYCDNHGPVTWSSQRPCPKCGELPTAFGQDPCIANLPGVHDACCGHGYDGYIAFEDGRMIQFPASKVEDWHAKMERVSRRRIIAALKARAAR